MMIGRVDEVDGHFVATKFVALTVPTECLYVPRKSPRTSVAETSSSGGVRIQTDWRSVALGYARVWFPILAIALPVMNAAAGKLHFATVMLGVNLLAISALAHRSGRLPEAEKARLRVLGTVTGLRIDPSKLQPGTREIKRALLGDLMEKGGLPLTPDGILSVLDDIPMPAMPLVYGYACYSGDDPDWRDCAALVYKRYEQGDI
jgi:hypothetical protein